MTLNRAGLLQGDMALVEMPAARRGRVDYV
jgi:hypothetical protein